VPADSRQVIAPGRLPARHCGPLISRRTARRALAPLLLGLYATLGVARDLTNAIRAAGLLRLSVALAFGAAAAMALGTVLKDARNRSLKMLAVAAVAAGTYAALVFPMESPEEKLHFIEYGAVALLAWAGAPQKAGGVQRFLFAVGFTALAGFTDECIQGLVPSRHYDVRDIAFNAIAGLLAVSTLEAVRAARRPTPEASTAIGETASVAASSGRAPPAQAELTAPRAALDAKIPTQLPTA
jgi:VanZ family protein